MNGAKVECDRVSRCHVPAADDELISLGIYVRYVIELLIRIERASVEACWAVAGGIPPMRPGDTFQTELRETGLEASKSSRCDHPPHSSRADLDATG